MNTLKNILVAVDFSAGSHSALKQAARIAHLNGAALHVLHVVDSMAVAMLARSLAESYESRARVASEGAGEALRLWVEQSGTEVDGKMMVAVGSPYSEILEHVRTMKADLLVVGITGTGESTVGAGGVSSKLTRKAKIPVLLVRASHSGAFRKMVAGIDFSGTSYEVAEQAHRLALQDGASVDFLHVWQEPWVAIPYFAVPFADAGVPVAGITPEQRKSYVQDLSRELHEFVKNAAAGITATEVLLEAGSYGKGIADHALESKADLIVVGGKGRTNLRYVLLGSTAERLLTRLPCSLLVVKNGRQINQSIPQA